MNKLPRQTKSCPNHLDRLYNQILSTIPSPNRDKAKAILCAVLYVSASTNTYQNEILSITELLLGLDAGESYSALRSVHSLLHIPQSFHAAHRDAMTHEEYEEWLKDGRHAVRFYHKSFPDFLEDRTCSLSMRISDRCSASGQPLTPELQEALRQFDVFACFTRMFLSAPWRQDSTRNPREEDCTIEIQSGRAFLVCILSLRLNLASVKLLIDHNLMFSSNFFLNQLQALNNWFRVCNSHRSDPMPDRYPQHSKCPSHLYNELDIILNEIPKEQDPKKKLSYFNAACVFFPTHPIRITRLLFMLLYLSAMLV